MFVRGSRLTQLDRMVRSGFKNLHCDEHLKIMKHLRTYIGGALFDTIMKTSNMGLKMRCVKV